MKNKKIYALGFGTANQGEQSQLIGALNAIAKLTKTEVDIDKQVLLPKNVDSLFEMKDNISFLDFKNYKSYKEYLYSLLDDYFSKTSFIPNVFIKVFNQAENNDAFINTDMTCKAIKEYYQEHNLGNIFTTILTSRYYKYKYVDLINIPKQLLNFSSRIRLLHNKELRKKSLITIGTVNNFSKELVDNKYEELNKKLEELKDDAEVRELVNKLLAYKKQKKHIVFCLGGRVSGQEIRFDLNYAKRIFQDAERLKSAGYGILFVNGHRTPNDVSDYLYEKANLDDKIVFCNCKKVAQSIDDRLDNYWRIYSGRNEFSFRRMQKLGNIYPGVLGIPNTLVVHTFDSYSSCETTVAGIPTAISSKGIYIDKDVRYDCHNLVSLLCPKYAIEWEDFFKLALNMKLEPKNLHPQNLSSSLRVFAESVMNRMEKADYL